MTITMIKGEFGVDVFLDHSTIGGWLAGEMAAEYNVPAICGPRSIDPVSRGFMNWAHTGYEGVRGVAAGYQERGVPLVGFNTDSPVISQEELPLQASMGCRPPQALQGDPQGEHGGRRGARRPGPHGPRVLQAVRSAA